MPEPTPVVAVVAKVDEEPGPTHVAPVRDRRPRGARARPRADQRGAVRARAADDRRLVPPAASVRPGVPQGRVLGGRVPVGPVQRGLARATAGREPPTPIAMHQPVHAPRGHAEMVALEQGDGQSRDGTTAMDVEAAHRGATHPDVIPEQHP